MRPAGTLVGKAALITGAASGIGRATALVMAREGAMLTLADKDESGGGETVRLVKELGAEARFVRTDVSDADAVESMVAVAQQAYGRLDCAVNAAGVLGPHAPSADYPMDAWNQVIAINLTGVWLCMRAEIRAMLKTGAGAIVNLSSVGGLRGAPNLSAYGAAKHGVIGVTRSAALEYARGGIRVVAICPGMTDTPMIQFAGRDAMNARAAATPLGRAGVPREIAELAAWLCSDAASFVSGSEIVVDGAQYA